VPSGGGLQAIFLPRQNRHANGGFFWLPLVVFTLAGLLLSPSAPVLLPASHETSTSISPLVPGEGLSRIGMEAWSLDVATGEWL
jgi:hypothetical protein